MIRPLRRERSSAGPGGDPGGEPLRDLARALAGAGPLGCACGAWLATRPDLVADGEAAPLAELGRRPATPLPASWVLARLEAALDRPMADAFGDFETRACAAGPLFQIHHAHLVDGRPARVKVLRPAAAEEMPGHLARLRDAAPALAAAGLRPDSLLAGFGRWLRRTTDLEREAAELAADPAGGEPPGMEPVSVVTGLSSPRVLTVLPPAGRELSIAEGEASLSADDPAAAATTALLRCALEGWPFPVPVSPAEVVVSEAGAVAWTGGPFTALPPLSRERLGRFLTTVAEGDPDAAGTLLAEESGLPGAAVEPLRRRLRQTVAWRDGGPGATDDLAADLFQVALAATREDVPLSPHWLAFLQALAGLAPAWRRPAAGPGAAAGHDPLREALARLTAERQLEEITGLALPTAWGRRGGLNAAALLALPAQVDALLNDGGPPPLRLRLRNGPDATPEAGRRLAWMVAVVALVFAAPPVSTALGVAGPAAEGVAAALVFVCGLGALGVGADRGGRRRRRRRGGPPA